MRGLPVFLFQEEQFLAEVSPLLEAEDVLSTLDIPCLGILLCEIGFRKSTMDISNVIQESIR